MKKLTPPQTILAQLLVLLLTGQALALPVIEPITYQGRLDDNGTPVSGLFELRVGVHEAGVGGALLEVVTNNVVVSNGLFTTVLQLDSASFTLGPRRWLELGVRTNGSLSDFTTLSPRQQLTYTPYALRATTADIARDLPEGLVTGYNIADDSITAVKFEANQVVKSLNALRDDVTLAAGSGITITPLGNILTIANNAADWKLTGNAGTVAGVNFLGTTDNQPLDFKVNGQRALRLEDNGDSITDGGTVPDGAPNLIGGSARNFVSAGVVGATIAGGGATNYANFAYTNSVGADFGVVGGGIGNSIAAGAAYATIVGGSGNTIAAEATFSTVAGGVRNRIGTGSSESVIGGGVRNTNNSGAATIAGGFINLIQTNADFSSLGGGRENVIQTATYHASIGGGFRNTIQTNAGQATIAGGNRNTVLADAQIAFIGGGLSNAVGGDYAVIAGGNNNTALGVNSFIGGGLKNVSSIGANVIAGGNFNTNHGGFAVIGGGQSNWATDDYAMIPGGLKNSAANFAFAAGRRAKANHTGAFVWADSTDADFASTANNQLLIRATGGVGIGTNNPAGAALAVVGGLRAGVNGTIQSRVQFGTTAVGTGVAGANTFTITFPTAFSTPPKIFVTARGNDTPDTFAISTRAVTASNFKVNIVRVDAAVGWGQSLQVDWYAVE